MRTVTNLICCNILLFEKIFWWYGTYIRWNILFFTFTDLRKLLVSTSTLFLLKSALKIDPIMVPAIIKVGKAMFVGSGGGKSSSVPPPPRKLSTKELTLSRPPPPPPCSEPESSDPVWWLLYLLPLPASEPRRKWEVLLKPKRIEFYVIFF